MKYRRILVDDQNGWYTINIQVKLWFGWQTIKVMEKIRRMKDGKEAKRTGKRTGSAFRR